MYKFNKEGHQHLLWSERNQEFQQLTGATTILEVLGKTLTWWASGLALEKLGWLNSKTHNEEQRLSHLKPIREEQMKLGDADYLSLLDEAYKAHSVRLTETADAGTDLHAELEKYVNWHIAFNSGNLENAQVQKWSDRVLQFATWADKNVKRFLWSEGYCYDEMLFMGGISDAGAELKDGSIAIIDFKSSKQAYFNHFVQTAIYDLLIQKHGILNEKGETVLKDVPKVSKYLVIPFGAKEFTVVENNNIKSLQKAALACIELYRAKGAFEN